MTLFQKLLLSIIIVVFIPVTLLGMLSFEQSRRQLEDITSVFLVDNIERNAERLVDSLNELDGLAEKVIGSSQVQNLLRNGRPQSFIEEAQFISSLKQASADLRGPHELYVLPKHTEWVPNYLTNLNLPLPSHQVPTLLSSAFELGGRPYWLHESADTLTVGDMLYVRAIRTLGDFQDAGVMVYKVSDDFLRKQLVPPNQYPNYRLALYHQSGEFAASSSKEDRLPLPELKSVEAKPSFNKTSIGGTPYYMASMLLPERPEWQLIATIPVADLTGHINKIKWFTVWFVIVSLSVILLLLLFIVNRYTSPIQRLVRHMKKVQLGHLQPFRLFGERKDEIGQLIRGYDAMTFGMTELLDQTKRMEAEKQGLQRRMLINQINPHFLYNTLDSIKWKAASAKEASIAEMVTTLADMLRFSITDETEWTTVERELEHARSYIQIELLRNPGSFHVLFDIQPTVQQLKVLKLIVQPLVENAIKHGISRCKDRKGKIIVSVFKEGEQLHIVVEDNGPGCDPQLSEKLGKGSFTVREDGGIGLYNVHRRIRLHYGDDFGLTAENVKPVGFRSELHHPILTSSHS